MKYKRWNTIFIFSLLIAALASSCTMARIYSTSGNTVALTTIKPGRAESFTITERRIFDYTNALDVQELLRKKFGSGVMVQNVTVKVQQDPADFLLNLVTIGIAQSRTFEISGDLIRNPEAK